MSTVTIVSRDALEDERLVPDGGEGVLLVFRLARLFLNVGGGVDVRGEGPEEGLGRRGNVVRRKDVEEEGGWAVTCHGFGLFATKEVEFSTTEQGGNNNRLRDFSLQKGPIDVR